MRLLRRNLTLVSGAQYSQWFFPGRRALYTGSFMPDNYFASYLPILLQFLLALGMAGGMVLLSTLLGKHKYSKVKMQAYECGITPTGDAQSRFSVKFYMVAMLFILFDVEAIFLIPWAVIFKELGMFGFWEMMVYLGIVLVGYFYIWKKGVLDWAKDEGAA